MEESLKNIAQIIIEADTPLAIGSGEKGSASDKLVVKDVNGLPYVPGSTLAGVLRHSLNKQLQDSTVINNLFGFGGESGEGSRLIISSANLLSEDGSTVVEGLCHHLDNDYFSYFSRLPERDHVRMNDKGAADADNHGKYDEELVHKGVRFVFRIEYSSQNTEEEKNNWKTLLNTFQSPLFRIGSGTRKGFGKIKVIAGLEKCFDLTEKENMLTYLNLTSSLNDSAIRSWKKINFESRENDELIHYQLRLKALDYFIFSSGFGDNEADQISKVEKYFIWDNGKPKLTEDEKLLIPATSIKGLLSHRVAYHYNLLNGETIQNRKVYKFLTTAEPEQVIKSEFSKYDVEKLKWNSNADDWDKLIKEIENISVDQFEAYHEFEQKLKDEAENPALISKATGENNEAVRELFGYSKNSELNVTGQRGRVIIDDLYLNYDKQRDKIFNHVKIDRFTAGTIDGALFQEKASQYQEEMVFDIWVEKTAFTQNTELRKAFESALEDITSERLSLGGKSTKGHGIFTGKMLIQEK